MTSAWRWTSIGAGLVLVSVTGALVALAWAWQERAAVADLKWPLADTVTDSIAGVTVTWLGVTTLLFDDGETQILTDGTFSRLSITDLFLMRRVYSDVDSINYALSRYRMDRLAAIIPLHSHFDHAMDVGHVANRTSAVVLGSESTANIARGAQVPVSQYQILADGESRQFGDFTITLIASEHAPLGRNDEPPFPGTIDKPLTQPARAFEWREGGTWSVLVEHPEGTALVHGSGGFVDGALPDDSADVIMLGIAGLSGLGRDYVQEYWRATVTRTGAKRVFPIHFDDFTRPFGEVALFPGIVDEVLVTAEWLDEMAVEADKPIEIRRLPFGQPVDLFPEPR